MPKSIQEAADRMLQEALEKSGARDPREFYRTQLMELRERDGDAYQQAVAYYRDTLLPSIAHEGSDPLRAWATYGRTLAELRAQGRTVAIDGTGRSRVVDEPGEEGELVLHLPNDQRVRAILVSLPPELSSAQRATYDWLVSGRKKLREDGA
jgi:hypothetical protein